jgi:hypothetical protein
MKILGVILLALGCFMIGPAILLHMRAGHLVAPRPIVLVFVSIGMMIAGAVVILTTGVLQPNLNRH